MFKKIAFICQNFNIKGEFVKFECLKEGNINQTFLVTFIENKQIRRYVLQKINSYVFKNPEKLMENIISVTNHIKNKIKYDTYRHVLEFLPCKNEYYYIDNQCNYWRIYKFINNSVTFNNPECLDIVYEAGYQFGKFQCYLNDFDLTKLYPTIKDFHNTKIRYKNLIFSAFKNNNNRLERVKDQLSYLISRKNLASYYIDLIERGDIPFRVTHNDTKCNNVLFDINTKKSLTVIDLDTVMKGIIGYDFGDSARSICSTCDEDELDTSKIDFDIKRFDSFCNGFLSQTKDILTLNEKTTLYLAPAVMCYELAVRFLTDYLDCDLYFKCDYLEHNFDRAKAQIALLKKIEDKNELIQNTIKKYL